AIVERGGQLVDDRFVIAADAAKRVGGLAADGVALVGEYTDDVLRRGGCLRSDAAKRPYRVKAHLFIGRFQERHQRRHGRFADFAPRGRSVEADVVILLRQRGDEPLHCRRRLRTQLAQLHHRLGADLGILVIELLEKLWQRWPRLGLGFLRGFLRGAADDKEENAKAEE